MPCKTFQMGSCDTYLCRTTNVDPGPGAMHRLQAMADNQNKFAEDLHHNNT